MVNQELLVKKKGLERKRHKTKVIVSFTCWFLFTLTRSQLLVFHHQVAHFEVAR